MNKPLAQLVNPVLTNALGGNTGKTGGQVLSSLLESILGGILIFSVILATFFLVSGGIMWITSGGDKGQLEAARNRILNSIVGLIVVAASWAIMSLIGKWFGIDIQNMPIPSFKG